MKQIVKKISWLKVAEVLLVAVMVLAPVAFAGAALSDSFGSCPPGMNCSAGTNVNQFIKTIINWLLGIAFGIAVLFLIIGGFWYITSAGNEETAEKGKSTAVNAIIGIIIIVLSYVIVNVVSNLVASGGSTGP